MFEDYFAHNPWASLSNYSNRAWSASFPSPVDVVETEEAFILRIDLKKHDTSTTKLVFRDGALIVSSHCLPSKSASSTQGLTSMSYWSFDIGHVPLGLVDAETNNNCLIITLPRQEDSEIDIFTV